MRIAQAVAGFTLGQADVLRKAMGKKDPKVMAKQREAFLDGAKAKGVSEKKASEALRADRVLRRLRLQQVALDRLRLARVSDGVSQGELPWHFAAALFTIEAQNTDKLAMYLAEARERGIPVLPPDINESQLQFLGGARQRRALRPDGDQGTRRRRDQRRSSRRARSSAAGSRRCTRCARSSTCASRTSACSRRWSSRARAIRSSAIQRQPTSRSSLLRDVGRGCLRRSTAPASTAAARSANKDLGQDGSVWRRRRVGAAGHGARCRTCRRGPRSSSCNYEKEALGLYWTGHPIDRYADGPARVRRQDHRRI